MNMSIVNIDQIGVKINKVQSTLWSHDNIIFSDSYIGIDIHI